MNSSHHITSAFTRKFFLWAVMLLLCLGAKAEIHIGGNVYGGGDRGKVSGNTTVEVKSGNIGTDDAQNPGGSVFGGARMADVGGNAYVNINGEEATDYILINRVYGGNDITGTIEGKSNRLPSEVAGNDMGVDGSWNAIIHISDGDDIIVNEKEQEKYPIFIGQLFGGGNGDYDYDTEGSTYYGLKRPETAKTFIDMHGGTISYAYAGGNAATVTEKAAIHVHNESKVVNSIVDDTEQLTDERFKAMGINTWLTYPHSDEFQIGRLFGGNNKAEMAIRPTWDLEEGLVRNLYSGGNQGAMTHKEGIFLEIPEGSNIVVDNVFGGCRMADVHPLLSGTLASGNYEESQKSDIQLHDDEGKQLYDFPTGFSARLLINGGDINNVYGGNDVTGTVYGGNAVGVATSIRGNVYGGGNGSYPYTDNAELLKDPDFVDIYGDLYYNPAELLNNTQLTFAEGASEDEIAAAKSLYSAQALNLFRPNAEQISIILMGTEEKHTEIGGVFCGGNSASIKTINDWVKNQEGGPTVELKISSYVYVDSVFLGNDGENMVTYNEEVKENEVLKKREGTLYTMARKFGANQTEKYNSMDLTDAETFKEYMMGAAMDQKPDMGFFNYTDYSSHIGSLYCGGNVGSMIYSGTNTMDFDVPIVVFDKVVGGCNNANVDATDYNAAYEGGIMGSASELAEDGLFRTDKAIDGAIQDRLVLNFEDLRIEPRRWKTESNGDYSRDANGNRVLEWNTVIWDNDKFVSTDQGSSANTTDDSKRRLAGGNIYGGCNNSGYVNGNVVININNDLIVRNKVFADTKEGTNIDPEDGKKELLVDDTKNRNSGVILDKQSYDVNSVAMTVFGAGYGDDTEIWGSTTVNLNKGYAFQIFGGGYAGEVGKKTAVSNDENVYVFNPEFSTTVSLNGKFPATSETGQVEDLPESEYLYAGGNEGNVAGNTYMYLGNGRIYDAFGGASAADILGHTEVYIGLQRDDNGGHTKSGFPWILDAVYGGNDYSGSIDGKGDYDFSSRVRDYSAIKSMIHGYNEPGENETEQVPRVLKSSAYVEYLQGHVDTIFGGSFGNYDYEPGEELPYLRNTFVNIRPIAHQYDSIKAIFGGSTGHHAVRNGDKSQDCSYVLIDIPDNIANFKDTEVFGAGSFNGLGMRFNEVDLASSATHLDEASAIIDLLHGNIGSVYGGSYNEGVTRRTVVNVPSASTINIKNIFGGAFGTQILPPCDVIETHVNYHNSSENARVTGAIYGGNNNERRSLYTQVNISSPVWSNKDRGYTATVYGGGRGIDTWSEYTEVNLEDGAIVYEVYGGGEMGHVLNSESVQKYMQLYKGQPSPQISRDDPKWKDNKYWNVDADGNKLSLKDEIVENEQTIDIKKMWAEDWADAWTLGGYYEPNDDYTDYVTNNATNLNNAPVRPELSGNKSTEGHLPSERFNANVIINEGATVVGYAYGGGLGDSNTPMSGDVYGTTYIALLGGKVIKDLYAAGTSGAVYNLFETKGTETFTASANAYIKGGSARNVYGGGWKGNVGKHDGDISTDPTNDLPCETNVVIGDIDGTGFTRGLPAIQRNAYGGGEGGAVFGTANITINNGYIGYVHLDADEKQNEKGEIVIAQGEGLVERFEEKIIDETHKNTETNQFIPNTNLYDAGCVFGGGYVDNSSVDKTNVTIYGGNIRNSAFGGGEIAAVGRGAVNEINQNDNIIRTLAGLYRPGKATIEMYGGHVHRNVFGGGRGYDNLGRYGSLHSDGTVFGQTEVHIHGGEIGDASRLSYGDGNVFGGGDIGYVFSAYEFEEEVTVGETPQTVTKFGRGVKPANSERYKDVYQGYYFKHQWEGDNSTGTNIDNDGFYTEDVTVGEETTQERMLTEDCKVLIEPYCKALEDVTINGHEYLAGTYVTTADLNTLRNKESDQDKWGKLDATGIIINNAVFAGGNTPSGKTATNAYMASVLGNATASVNDVYHRDLITLGTGHTGGLYGDGNLTLVDGYRELNITNYGTDYYSIEKEIDINAYHALPDREAAYYELRYTCLEDCKDKDGTTYTKAKEENGVTTKASTITADDMLNLFLTEVKDGNGNIVYEADGITPKMQSIQYGGNDVLMYDETEHQWKPNENGSGKPIFWEESGVLPIYAGRLMNTIQRADFCGVWGSRMVLQGARDRVPDEADFTNYTINRVREVSLNAKKSVRIGGSYDEPDTDDKLQHGNYFGIYNIVNYLGALTSDVDFDDYVRTTDNDNHELYDPDLNPDEATITLKTGLTNEEKTKALSAANAINGVTVSGETITAQTVEGLYKLRSVPGLEIVANRLTDQTFAQWKQVHHTERKRNNGNSHNKVALASGVYLELTTEESFGTGLYEKEWGPITGVIELDLINVSPGIGGGFVYAKNEHGVRTKANHKNTTLTDLNEGAVTQWDYEYSTEQSTDKQMEWQTSGNFVHSTQTIIDDCYNISNKYMGDGKVPAHYWFIKGSVYVYDQYISAYTGSPNAFSEAVDIPLTITAGAHGSLKLLDVQPNLYAYYSSPSVKIESGKKIVINDKTYYLNDPISYWDWYLLTKSERALFVPMTYVNCITCYIDGTKYEAGTYVMNENEFSTYKNSAHVYTDAEGNVIQKADKTDADDGYIFRKSNNLGHNEGYILTYQMNNPGMWDTWYTDKSNYQDKIKVEVYNNLPKSTDHTTTPATKGKDAYYDGPTYRLDQSKLEQGATNIVLGQSDYQVGNIISENVEINYPYRNSDNKPDDQATFERAYLITSEVTITEGNENRHLNPGATIPKSKAEAISANAAEAFICAKTIQLNKTDIIPLDTKMTKAQRDSYVNPVHTSIRSIIGEGVTDERLKEIRKIEDVTEVDLTDAQKTTLKPLLSLKNDFDDYLVAAYYCTEPGKYGGQYYYTDNIYRGLEAWSSMSDYDREYFIFNYDALDLFIDPTYARDEGKKYQYDGNYTTAEQVKNGNAAHYSLEQSLDYTATYIGNETGTYNGITLSNSQEYSNEEFEKLPNEQRHYVAIKVKDGKEVKTGEGNDIVTTYDVYVVSHSSFQIGNTPYSIGSTIDYDTYQALTDKSKITKLTFPASDKDNTYYYCRESYEVGYNDNGVAVTNVNNVEGTEGLDADGNSIEIKTTAYETRNQVPIGLIINETNYGLLKDNNKQKDFIFHGISPTETSTLYVSKESDIYNLSKDKIITVVYEYNYDENDENGNVTPVSERHVLNIHLAFESGIPYVDDIDKPEIILPGDYIGLKEPDVTPGAFEVTGGGWELFETARDADSHTNGIEYNPTFDPLYWYQHDWYVAYYAKTYLGRTYSKAVPVSVANYHDLANVMADANKTHHMYIDREDVKRAPKIYINDYSQSQQNGLDLLKDLFDLSLLDGDIEGKTQDGVVTAEGTLEGHHILSNYVEGANNLEFILRTDIDHSDSPWTSIGDDGDEDPSNDPCFEGILHGDGYTITGLSSSLFKNLCSAVYNLGVTGSFSGAGVAETGTGYIENSWINTTGTLNGNVYAVFGNPTGGEGKVQLVNSYYTEGLVYKTTGATHGLATPKPAKAFYNGEVAFDLNSFYLNKRYLTATNATGGTEHLFIDTNPDGTLQKRPSSYYNGELEQQYIYGDIGYVESRYKFEDFRYAAGTIPTSADSRYLEYKVDENNEDSETKTGYYPIWPGDYLFFGQALTYGYDPDKQHQNVPSHYNGDYNRVLRAPAYFGNKTMDVVHFNADANLAQKSADGTKVAYPGMTAIDLHGHNDADQAYSLALNDGNKFYGPLLDTIGLNSIANRDETRNLLVYAPTDKDGNNKDINGKTLSTLIKYFKEPIYLSEYDNSNDYRIVYETDASTVNGHLVNSNLVSINDHLLVDKQDFNAPIAYKFISGDDGTRMWYQRKPDLYMESQTGGWETVSLPFEVELVTTHQKGEITHFYDGNTIGHEYWLRELSEITSAPDQNDANKTIYTSVFKSLDKAQSGSKSVTNTFLWDYYYSKLDGTTDPQRNRAQDKNADEYQVYYNTSHTYDKYPYASAGTPYLIGLPGKRFYEFDLSGQFVAQNTADNPSKLEKQMITFASETGASINVTDTEYEEAKALSSANANGFKYTFVPTYQTKPVTDAYMINTDGNIFEQEATGTTVPFRPYFTVTVSASSNAQKRGTRANMLYIGYQGESDQLEETVVNHGLFIYSENMKICVESTLEYPAEVTITTVEGKQLKQFTIQPATKVSVPVNSRGVYIVNHQKIAVTK